MSVADYRDKSIDELQETLKTLKEELVDNSISVLRGKEKNVKKNKIIQKEIARVMTIINEKKILESVENA